MLVMLRIWVIALACLLSFCTANCSDDLVFSLPVTYVHLHNNWNMRGIPISVGTPPRNLSLMPQPYFNDTWIYNSTTDFCDWLAPQGCETVRGGLYNPSGSSTCENASSVAAAGGDPSDTLRALGLHIWESEWVNDIIGVGSTKLKSFPIGLPGKAIYDPYITQSQLGLGFNSTFLGALQAAGAIAIQAYSWWWGLQGSTPESQVDGQIVFGGYDSAMVQGSNYTQPLNKPDYACNSGMVVTITDLTLTFPNGTQFSILEPNQLVACILPDYPLILTMPWDETYDRFEALSQTQNIGRVGGNGIGFGGMGYLLNNVYDGSLTVQIDNSIEFEFPNELLVVPPTNVVGNGSIQTNETVLEVMLNPTSGYIENDPPILGRHFFQAAYLMVDYSSETFTLWSANTSATESNLVALDSCSNVKANKPSHPEPTNTSSLSNPTITHSATVPMKSGSTSSGAQISLSLAEIIGIAVGGASAVVLLSIAACLLYRRRKARKAKVRKQDIGNLAQWKAEEWEHYSANGMRVEAMSSQRNELYAYENPRELASSVGAWELAGD